MTRLKRSTPNETRAAANLRYLAPGEETPAKQQAYILRDLIRQHCGVTLSGGDVTDCFALVYHGMDWAALMANRRGKSASPYYGAQPRDAVLSQVSMLRNLLGPCEGDLARALQDMPRAEYRQPRTMAGAQLCTLLAGQPSWHLLDANEEKGDDKPLVYDAATDKGCIPKHFNSDPMDNSERLCGLDPESRQEVIIPIERVRYVQLERSEGEQKVDYVLTEHARSIEAARAFYPKALSYSMARRWFNAGNDLYMMVFYGGTKAVRCRLGEWVAEGEKQDFDQAMSVLREFHPGCNVVMTPRGLDEVRDPAERWAPSFKHVHAILPEVEAADAAYQSVLYSLGDTSCVDAETQIRNAIRKYNEVLLRALEAFWLDTREINGRQTVFQAFGSSDLEGRLALADVGPLQKLREMVGLDAKGDPRKPQPAAVDAVSPELMQRRLDRPNLTAANPPF